MKRFADLFAKSSKNGLMTADMAADWFRKSKLEEGEISAM